APGTHPGSGGPGPARRPRSSPSAVRFSAPCPHPRRRRARRQAENPGPGAGPQPLWDRRAVPTRMVVRSVAHRGAPAMACKLTPALVALLVACPAGPAQGPANPPKVERFRLDNGLQVILRPVKGSKYVALVTLFALGEDHDPKGKSGLGHMLEHLYFTGPAGGEKARTIEDILARYPDRWNAQTGTDYTVLATVFPRADLRAELKDAAARMGDLRHGEDDLKRERPRVLDEVANMFGGIPAFAARNHARELVRPAPLGGRKGGAPSHVEGLTLA